LGRRILPAPEIRVQVPVPDVIADADKADVVPQICWSIPAFAVIGFWSTTIFKVSLDELHVPFETDQISVFTPGFKPLTEVFGDVGSRIVPEPEVINQKPSPINGISALIGELVAHVFKSGPELAELGS